MSSGERGGGRPANGRGPRVEVVRARRPPGSGARWVLGVQDRANLILVLRGTWLFREPLDPARMKAALAELLCFYPHLAGRFVERASAVALTNEGVPFELASRPEASVDDLGPEAPTVDPFTPSFARGRVKRGRAAPMAVRLTELRDGAALVVCCTHGCLDGTSFYTMVRNWGRICSARPFPEPLLDQSLLPRPEGRTKAEALREAEAAGWRRLSLLRLAPVLVGFARGSYLERAPALRLSAEGLARLKARAAEAADREGLSTNEALSAHLALACARLHGLEEGTRCSAVCIADGRGRLAGCPPELVGNLALPVVTPDLVAGSSLGEAAARVHDCLAPYLERPSEAFGHDFRLALEMAHHRAPMLPYDLAAMYARRPTLTYLNNFSKLPVYDVDFGDPARPVRPWRVVPHNLPDPVLIWPAAPEVGGLEVYLTGIAARAARRLAGDDPFWAELRLE